MSIYIAFLLPSQLAPDWLRVMSNGTIASCQKSLQLERDSDDKNNHIFSKSSPTAFLDMLLEMFYVRCDATRAYLVVVLFNGTSCASSHRFSFEELCFCRSCLILHDSGAL